ncbi:hypothetical protein ACFL02_00875, partial [Planctomycetota bacterium]
LKAIKALEQLTGGEVELEEASLDILQEIRIKGLRIFLPDRDHTPDNLVFAAQDVIIRHHPWSILQRQLRLKEIVAYGPKLQIWHDRTNKETNLLLLEPLKETQNISERPKVVLRQGTIEYFEMENGQSTVRARQNIQGQIYPDPQEKKDVYLFEFSNDKMGVLQKLEGSYDLQNKRLYTKGNFLMELKDFVQQPGRVADWQRLYEISQPSGQVHTETRYDPNTGHHIRLVLENGSLRLPVPGVELPLHEVTGEILCTNQSIIIDNIEGYYEDYCRFHINGVIEGYSRDAPFNIQIKTEGLIIPPDQWTAVDEAMIEADPNELLDLLKPPLGSLLGLLSPNIRRTVRRFSPTGEFDLELQIRNSSPEKGRRYAYEGVLICHNAVGSDAGFPYQVEGIHGEIALAWDQVKIGPLKSQMGELDVQVEGQWSKKEGEESEFEITVGAQNLTLDKKLYAALRPSHQQWWRQFQPGGIVNSVYKRKRQGSKVTQETLDVKILEANACYQAFPIPLSQMAGEAHWADDQVVFDITEAQAAMGQLSIAGTVTNPRSPEPALEGKVKFDQIQLDENFSSSLPEQPRRFFEKVTLTGRAAGQANFQGALRKNHESSLGADPNIVEPRIKLDFQLSGEVKEGRLLYKEFPYELQEVEAKVELSNKELSIKNLQGRNENSQISLVGVMQSADEYRLHIEGKPLQLDVSLREAFGEKELWFWDKLNPSGSARVTMDLERQAVNEAQTERAFVSSYRAVIEPLSSRVELSNFAYPFNDITGTIIAEPNLITIDPLDPLTSIEGSSRVSLTGTIRRVVSEQDYDLYLEAEAIELDEKLREALPKSVGAVWNRFEPGGSVGFNLHIVRAQGGPWNLGGRTRLKGGNLDQPALTDEIDAQFEGQAEYDSLSKSLGFSGRLEGQTLQIKKRPLTNLSGLVRYDGKLKELLISDISSGFCRGRMAGEVKVSFGDDPSGYELKLRFNDVDLAEYMKFESAEPEQDRQLKGRCDGRFYVIKPGASSRQRGRFSFVVREAVLGELPIWAQLLHVPSLSLPREGAFNEAILTGDVAAERYIFDSIYLRGSAVALDGAGIMTGADHNLDLVFGIESPHKLPRVPLLTSLFKAVRRGFAQVRVTGSFEKPKVEPIAFPTLEEALRILIPQAPNPEIRGPVPK